MRRLLILFLCSILYSAAQGQKLDPGDYVYPILGVRGLYAANFGEIRTGHFHAGVDIKTEGMEGMQLVAVSDGYISRVVLTPGGYGRAVYVVTNKGTTAVYGHLQRFRDDIEAYVRNERYGRKVNSVDLWFKPGVWPVKQGECVGWSGNSGSSAGPHLHYELRETATGRRLNTVREGIIRPVDNIPPRIVRIHYVEADTIGGVCLRSQLQSYAIQEIAPGRYRLAQREPLRVGRQGYFIAEVTDRRNAVLNTFGVWRLTAQVDEKPYFEYRMDGFMPEHARCCDAVACYQLQKTSRCEVIRLAQLADCSGCLYTLMEERGIVRTAEGQQRHIRIQAEDDCGNRSEIEFDIVGRAESFRATSDTTAMVLSPRSKAVVRLKGELTATVPAGALYEAVRCRPERLEAPQSDSGLVVLSPAYRILDESAPLRQSIAVAIRAKVPLAMQLCTSLARVTPKGLAFVGGTYTQGVVSAETRATEALVVVADTLPPQAVACFTDGENLTREKALRFRVRDNFSGITAWSLRIDGEWVPCDRFPVQNTLVHLFDKPAQKCTHSVELTVTDACGNTASWKGRFYR